MVFKGTTSGSIASSPKNIPSDIVSYSLVNNTGGAITVTVTIVDELFSSTVVNYQALAANATYIYEGKPIRMKANYYIIITASGSLGYYFTIV